MATSRTAPGLSLNEPTAPCEGDHRPALPYPELKGRPSIAAVRPQVDGGRWPVKAAVGDLLRVEADAFMDGHQVLWCQVRFRQGEGAWSSVTMEPLPDDRWRGTVPITTLGRYQFCVRAGVDHFETWRRDLLARAEGDQDLGVELAGGAELIDAAASRAKGADRRRLATMAALLRDDPRGLESDAPKSAAEWVGATTLGDVVFSEPLGRLMRELGDPEHTSESDIVTVVVDPPKARCSAWYELFPRSASPDPRHGTFDDVRSQLDYVEQMGFDVLYLPPIHPIGRIGRKGREGSTRAGTDDPGSPWAIGGPEGGHRAIHPGLGTIEQFRALVDDAASRGIDVAIDLAFQTSPDHPWVTEHPTWFRHRADGTIRYAENPPKRYEDIYPLDFESQDWQALWAELLAVVRYWIGQGVKVFRVDNPHTKPFAFWEWLLASVKREDPEIIFLAEAFTRPRVMEQLAKLGFTQSYTYFTWRSSKWELETYLTELTRSEVADYFRPNFWPATPDILTEELQAGGRAAFLSRFVLAATLSANYGIYGPAFELMEHVPRAPGSEEFRRSEKYEIRTWDRDNPESLAGLIGQVNRIRREHPSLQFNDALNFHGVDNDQIMAYSKQRAGTLGDDIVVVVVNLDHFATQSGWVYLDLDSLGLDASRPYVMHDLLTDARYVWSGSPNFVRLDPDEVPCHVFSLEPTRRDGGTP